MYAVVVTLHVTVSLILIAVILLQAGRGGGLSEAFGGGSTQSILGTKAPVFFTRATTAAAILFLITCIILGIMTGRRGRSLIDLKRRQGTLPVTTFPFEGLPGEEQKEGKPLDTEKVPELPKAEPEAK